MPYATLMVPVDESKASQARVEFACELAGHFGCSLLGVAARRPETPFIAPNATMAVVRELLATEMQKAEAELKRAESGFRALIAGHNVPSKWRSTLTDLTSTVAMEARAVDLIVIGRNRPGIVPSYAVDPGDVLIGGGRPVLVTPPDVPAGAIMSHVVIAWTDSREARRAVMDAMPFLQAAIQVTVLEICGSDDVRNARARTADVVAFLALRAISAEVAVLPAVGLSVAQRLIAFARDEGAGLIVMGAYGHARLREWAFGGVTREMLETSPVCLLLSN